MQVKKFEAPTMQEALELVKKELGPEAIVLQTRKNKKGLGLMAGGSYEVTAAASERAMQKKSLVHKMFSKSGAESIEKMPAQKQASIMDAEMDRHLQRMAMKKDHVEIRRSKLSQRFIDIDAQNNPVPIAQPVRATPEKIQFNNTFPSQLNHGLPVAQAPDMTQKMSEEIRQLRALIEGLKDSPPSSNSSSVFGTDEMTEAFELMLLSGVEKRIALKLMKQVGFELSSVEQASQDAVMDQLAAEIMGSVQTVSLLDQIEPGAGRAIKIALVGPTGVGKTTTIAKIASQAKIEKHLSVGLINLDQYRVGAFDQLATYSRLLGVPFRSVATSADFKAALADFSKMDLILIDTTGRSQKDMESLTELENLLNSIDDVRTALVLSSNTKDADLNETTKRYDRLRPLGLIFSKLDETSVCGSILNISARSKLPLIYFTLGQRVPEDIERATPERVTSIILQL